MRRRRILVGAVGVVAAVFGSPLPALADASSPRRIGFFSGGPPDIPSPNLVHFVAGLAELGWREARDFVVLYRGGAGRVERYPALIAELIAAGAELVIVPGPAELAAARAMTPALPIVFVDVPDPIALGAVDSLARPGRNATGLTSMGVELAAKRLELLAEMVPGLRRAGEVRTPGLSNGEGKVAASQAAATRLGGIEVVDVVVRDAEEIEPALIAAARAGIGALLVQHNAITIVHREQVVRLVAAHRLPAIYEDRLFVTAGGLMSYGGDLVANYRRAAFYADRILRGTPAGELPVEQASRFEFVINVPIARALGLSIAPSLLARADEVIE